MLPRACSRVFDKAEDVLANVIDTKKASHAPTSWGQAAIDEVLDVPHEEFGR